MAYRTVEVSKLEHDGKKKQNLPVCMVKELSFIMLKMTEMESKKVILELKQFELPTQTHACVLT